MKKSKIRIRVKLFITAKTWLTICKGGRFSRKAFQKLN